MKKLKTLALVILSCMTFASCGGSEKEASSYKQISAEAAMELMEKEEGYVTFVLRKNTMKNIFQEQFLFQMKPLEQRKFPNFRIRNK